jgi:hypothetical protein
VHGGLCLFFLGRTNKGTVTTWIFQFR